MQRLGNLLVRLGERIKTIKLRKLRKEDLSEAGIIIVFLIAAISILSRGANLEGLKQFIIAQGALGPVIFSSLVLISAIIAPISTFPLWPMAFYTWGFGVAVLTTFTGSFLGGVANFYIAQRFGRPIVEKLVGKKTMQHIDRFSKMEGTRALLILRILAANYFDYISYAAGLTTIPIKTYVFISFPTSLVWIALLYYLIDKSIQSLGPYAIVVAVIGYLIGAFGFYIAYRMYKETPEKK